MNAWRIVIAAWLIGGARFAEEPLRDRYGDPLPPGAIARLGTTRWRAGMIWSIEYMPNGRIVTDSHAGIRVWEADGSSRRIKLTNHGPGRSFAVSADSTKVAVFDGEDISLWSTKTCQHISDVRTEHKLFGAPDVMFAADQASVIALAGDASLVHIHLSTSKSSIVVAGDENVLDGLALSRDGKRFARSRRPNSARSSPSVVEIVSTTDGKVLQQLKGHQSFVARGTFSRDGKLLATRSTDNTVRLWDTESGKELRAWNLTGFDRKSRSASMLQFSPDGRILAFDNGWWDVRTGAVARQLDTLCSYREGRPLAFSPDGKTVAALDDEATIRRWDVATGKELSPLDAPRDRAAEPAVSADGTMIITTGIAYPGLRVWDAHSGAQLRQIPLRKPFEHLQPELSPDGKHLVMHYRQDLQLWDTSTWSLVRPFIKPDSDVHAVQFSADGKQTIVSYQDGSVYFYDLATARPKAHWQVKTTQGRFALSPNGDYCAIENFGKWKIGVFASKDGSLLGEFKASLPEFVGFVGDGRHLLVWDRDHPILWSVPLGRQVPLQGWTESAQTKPDDAFVNVRGVALHPDQSTLAVWSDEDLSLWELRTGREILTCHAHDSDINYVKFLGNGKTVLTFSDEPAGCVWDIGRIIRLKQGPAADIDQGWASLADLDPKAAYRFIFDLSDNPKTALPLLRDRLQPLPPLDGKKIASLIAALADERFAERERAVAELLRLDDRVIPLLQATQQKGSTAEQRRRIADLLRQRESHSDRLRQSRALRVLELIGPQAVPLLRELTRHPDAEFRADAEAALARATRRNAN